MLHGLDGYIEHAKRVKERKQYLEDRYEHVTQGQIQDLEGHEP